MNRASLLLLAAAALAACPAAPARALPPAAAQEAPPADSVAQATKLRDEGKKLFETAADTDLSREERKKARQESYAVLDRAKKLLDEQTETA